MNITTEINNFFLAYGQEQVQLGQHLSAKTELERKSRALYQSLAKQYDEMPKLIVLNSPYGTLLLTIDIYGEAIRKIEEVENFNSLNPKKYHRYIAQLNLSQLAGLGTLIFLSIREKTTIAYQHKEWGFTDIPRETIDLIDQLTDTEQLQIANSIALALA